MAVSGVAPDDARVVFDADGSRQLRHQAGEESRAASLLQALAAGQLVRDGDLVDRLVPIEEGEARFVGPAVLLAVKVLRSHDALDLKDRISIYHERGEHRLLSLDVERG